MGKRISGVRPALPIGLADAKNPHVVVAAFGLKGVLHQHFEGAGEEFGAVRSVGSVLYVWSGVLLADMVFSFLRVG